MSVALATHAQSRHFEAAKHETLVSLQLIAMPGNYATVHRQITPKKELQ